MMTDLFWRNHVGLLCCSEYSEVLVYVNQQHTYRIFLIIGKEDGIICRKRSCKWSPNSYFEIRVRPVVLFTSPPSTGSLHFGRACFLGDLRNWQSVIVFLTAVVAHKIVATQKCMPWLTLDRYLYFSLRNSHVVYQGNCHFLAASLWNLDWIQHSSFLLYKIEIEEKQVLMWTGFVLQSFVFNLINFIN